MVKASALNTEIGNRTPLSLLGSASDNIRSFDGLPNQVPGGGAVGSVLPYQVPGGGVGGVAVGSVL